ncbi:ABC transporter permease [Stappia sp. ES.058]|uniref:ABC transporter permease n=1 Tax=Stappia sp. ES.058 TaxID=1881061 RepID=UPI0008797BD5|nr:ABC transporter permease [Stappia sp. ES.058]SDU04848.1 amino acid ABC transporter membrane protein 2, PAAT family [Stappia sp. ES.058]
MSQDGASAPQRPPPPLPRGWTGSRIAGHVLVTLWAIAGAYLLYYLATNLLSSFVQKYWDDYIDGIVITIQLVVMSMVLGALLSLPIALARSSHNIVLSSVAYAFVYFFRGTPLLAQTFLIYYGAGSFQPLFSDLGIWWFFRDAWYCAVFAFTLNTSAYQAEILRGAVQNVDRGQWEAASALGIRKGVTFWKVILPQALIVALRPYGNELILMIKGSAIASIITIYDLMGETRRAYSRSYDFQAYIWAAVLYLIVVETLRRIWDKLEMRLTRHLKRNG